jgi:Zn-dependent protease/predicted transcriptional regulator
MGEGIRVGRILGINIHVDWSWLFVFALITWSLANAIGQFRTDWAPWTPWLLAALAAMLFFASVLAHELAHSLAARAQGLPVRQITLFIFGGVSNIQREPDSPGGEFVMAIVGPLTSLVIGMALLLAASVGIVTTTDLMQRPQELLATLGLAGALAIWLGSVNLLLGFFNLVPAFPLDGGRVVRSIFWWLTGSLKRATRWATAIGQGIAWVFILAGIAMVFGAQVPLLGSGLLNGLWLAFIGWFLSNAATRSYRHVVIQDILADVPVAKIMRRNPPVVSPHISVAALVHDHIMGTDDYGFPVLDDGDLVGLVTLEDVRGVERSRWESLTVQDIMTPRPELLVVTSDDDGATAFDVLMQRDVRQLPVLEGSHLIGLLRRNDLVRWLQLQSQSEL